MERLIPISMHYYDEKQRHVRALTFEDVGELGGRTLPKRVVLTPLGADKQGQRTVMVYEALEFNIPLDPSFFSLTRLQSER